MKKNEEYINADLALFRDLINKSNDAIFVADPPTGMFIFVNDKACHALGYDRPELLGMGVMDIEATLPDDSSWQEHVSELREEGALIFEGTHRRKDGTTFPVEANISHISLNTKEYLVAVIRDVSERRQSEDKLRQSEARLAEAQRIAHIGSWEWHLENNDAFWSDETYRIFGVKHGKLERHRESFLNMILPDDRDKVDQAISDAISGAGDYDIDYRIKLADGTEKVIHAQAEVVRNNDGKPVLMRGTVHDVTDLKYHEERLRKITAAILKLDEHDYAGNLNALTTLCGELLGADCALYNRLDGNMLCVRGLWAGPPDLKKEDKPQGHICFDVISHDSDIPLIVRNLGGTAYAKTDPNVAAYDLKTYIGCRVRFGGNSRGSLCVVFTRDYEPTADDLDVLRIVAAAVAQEEERYAAVERLQKSEEFIRSVLDTVDESFIVLDRDFRIMTANKAYCDWMNLADDQVIGRSCYEIVYGKSRPCYEEGQECVVRQAFEDGQPHQEISRYTNRDGHLLFLENKGFPIKNETGNVTAVIHTINDITERQLLEEERLKTQKLESIGTLAGGIAHDFNNLLQGIFGNISMAKAFIGQKEKSLSMLEQAENALHQSVSLTTQLLTFAKGGKPVKKRISLLPVIDSAAKFALSGSRSTCRLDIESGLWQVDADRGQIGRVIQNMVLNADQAMPEGGAVIITARNVEEWDRDNGRVPTGKYVEISIQDSGIGIPGKYLVKIFDPYFTTKEKGSGLGLATSYSIIRGHGGAVDVTSEPGKGTTFRIHLPAVEAAEGIEDIVSVSSSTARGKILVMDDEEIVRTVAGQFLESLNHEVELTENGEALLDKYREAKAKGKPFDIVILDLTVRGGMGGMEAIQHLLAFDPDVKAVVSSGYSDDDIVADYGKYGFAAFLTKPYKLENLKNTLDALLSTDK